MTFKVCIGLDPNPKYFEGFLNQKFVELGAKNFLIQFGRSIADAAKVTSSLVKFQSAFYERFGADGYLALEESIAYCKQKELYTILDAKRSDIGSTMDAYLDSAFNRLGVDALTVVPWIGLDFLIDAMVSYPNREIIIVGLSSNSDGAAFQLASVGGEPALDHILTLIERSQISHQTGFVVGLTSFSKLTDGQLSLLKNKKILMPGVGFQGGEISKRLSDFSRQASILLSASRSVTLVGVAEAQIQSWSDYTSWVARQATSVLP